MRRTLARLGGIEETAGPLSLVIKPVAVDHETCFGATSTRTIQVLLDPREADELTRIQPAAREWGWIHQGPFVRPFLELARAVRAGEPAAIELAMLDALAAVGSLPGPRGKLPAVIRSVQEHLDEPVVPRISRLAREAGLHPVSLARVFRRWFGMTMTQYARRSRVRRVISRLTPGVSLSAVAYETGFADQAHLCRIFRAETGFTPSGYRRLCT